jgi:putative flippase GtrA
MVGVAIGLLPGSMQRRATPGRVAVLVDFIRFGFVGLAGFAVDAGTVYATRDELGLYVAGLVSYVFAATTTWLLNRVWTYRGHGSGPVHQQWGLFLLVNGLGFVLNRGTYMALITAVPFCAEHPVLAIIGGVAMGLGANFWLSRRLVFGKI